MYFATLTASATAERNAGESRSSRSRGATRIAVARRITFRFRASSDTGVLYSEEMAKATRALTLHNLWSRIARCRCFPPDARIWRLFVLPVPRLPGRVLLVIDDLTHGELLARLLLAEGHEVRWARDTVEARWVWMRNYFEAVIVCAQGATGFVQHIRKESPSQNITVVTPDELLAAMKKPVAGVASISDRAFGSKKKYTNVVEMPRRDRVPTHTRNSEKAK